VELADRRPEPDQGCVGDVGALVRPGVVGLAPVEAVVAVHRAVGSLVLVGLGREVVVRLVLDGLEDAWVAATGVVGAMRGEEVDHAVVVQAELGEGSREVGAAVEDQRAIDLVGAVAPGVVGDAAEDGTEDLPGLVIAAAVGAVPVGHLVEGHPPTRELPLKS